MFDLFDFQWEVAETGYEWVRNSQVGCEWVKDAYRIERSDFLLPLPRQQKIVRANKSKYLSELGYGRDSIIRNPGKLLDNGEDLEYVVDEFPLRYTTPLESNSTLFREFASTSPTREGIKAFANRYGLLWHGLNEDRPWEGLWWGDGGSDTFPPSFDLWVQNILVLRLAITLWEMARDEDIGRLASYVHWRSSSEVSIEHPCIASACDTLKHWDINLLFIDGHIHPANNKQLPMLHVKQDVDFIPSKLFTPNDLVAPALAYVLALVQIHVERAITLTMGGPPREQKPGLRFKPDSLLSAIWCQFALAITGNKKHKQCSAPGCAKWFELTPSVNRADRLFCSDACRTRAYRHRIATANRRSRPRR